VGRAEATLRCAGQEEQQPDARQGQGVKSRERQAAAAGRLPPARARSTRALIAGSRAGAFWNSSMQKGSAAPSTNPVGSSLAASRGPSSSRVT
jgi:hypothetical protein